jgi:hypothetical protein
VGYARPGGKPRAARLVRARRRPSVARGDPGAWRRPRWSRLRRWNWGKRPTIGRLPRLNLAFSIPRNAKRPIIGRLIEEVCTGKGRIAISPASMECSNSARSSDEGAHSAPWRVLQAPPMPLASSDPNVNRRPIVHDVRGHASRERGMRSEGGDDRLAAEDTAGEVGSAYRFGEHAQFRP